jgi:hypothetical protein
MMKQFFFLIILLFSLQSINASDSLIVQINKSQFIQGDTINIDGVYNYLDKSSAAITLNVWIENIEKTRIWKFRYPILNGEIQADIVIDETLPEGKYAVNFLVQKDFFTIKGKVRDYNPKSKGLIYLMMSKGKANYIGNLLPDPDGNFQIGKMAFPDTARFVFSPISKRTNDLKIDIVTSLDSLFTPAFVTTQFITFGNPKLTLADTIKPYVFDESKLKEGLTLENVTVTATRKKKIDQFDEEVASGMFQGYATIFDGLTDSNIASAADIFSFLQGRVAGLDIKLSLESGGYNVRWRNSNVAIYLDEFRIDASDPMMVNPADVAMIKVFRPGEGGPTNGGAIAIYTKRGAYLDSSSRRYNFLVRGYTPLLCVWK